MYKLIIILILVVYSYSIDIPNQNQLQKEEQRKRFNQQQELLKQKFNKPKATKKLELNGETKDKQCIEIKNITYDKSDILTKAKQEEFSKEYINKCNSITKINNLAKKISNYFIEQGYSTSRAYIKPQKLTSKKLHISIMEGKIDKFVVKDLNTDLIFFNMNNKTLNLRNLEIGIEQLERLKWNDPDSVDSFLIN